MKAWLAENRKLIINACLAAAYVGVTTFTAGGGDLSVAAVVAAAGAAGRFLIGYIFKHIEGAPTIPVDE